ncbi:MAG TPA: enoyl-CoA hydratase/isomerase family protein [Nocardioidaceae bacterium]|nr:enoyl-CoA hydratase/isomerase family protein [Nocardioidaceae bacterium]
MTVERHAQSTTPADGAGHEQPVVRYEERDGVGMITLNRPDRLNAVTPELVEALILAIDHAVSSDPGAVILRGAGRAFCAGYDLKQPAAKDDHGAERYRLHRVQDVTRKIRQAHIPFVAAVHGFALGAGCEFALGCDLVVAAQSARFGFPEVSVGLGITGGASHILPMSVGLPKAKELVLLGETFDATEAHRLCLVYRVVPDEALGDSARQLAETLRDKPRRALSLAKLAIDRGVQGGIDAAYETEIANAMVLHDTADARRASEQFRARSTTATPGLAAE